MISLSSRQVKSIAFVDDVNVYDVCMWYSDLDVTYIKKVEARLVVKNACVYIIHTIVILR